MGLFLPAPPVPAGLPARSGVSFAGAVVGHVLVLAAILLVVPAERIAEAVRPMAVRLIELAPKAPTPEPPRPKEVPRPAKAQPVTPMPVLTAQPAVQSPAPAAFTVAPQPPTPSASPAPAPVAAPAPESVATAPRFDADYLHNPKPNYPPASRRLGEEGKVVLRVHVGADGQADKVELKTTSGFARLDAAAQEAVARWRFVPARKGDDAVAAWVLVPITFSLES